MNSTADHAIEMLREIQSSDAFVMYAVDGLRHQGMYIKLSEDEVSKFMTDWRLQFGGNQGRSSVRR